MRKLIVSLLFLTYQQFCYAGTATPLSESNCEPSSIVAGCVNVISGSYTETITPLILAGPDILTLSYGFNSAPGYSPVSEWLHDLELGTAFGMKGKYLEFFPSEGIGSFPLLRSDTKISGDDFLRGKLKKRMKFFFDCDQVKDGIANSHSGYIGGKTNIKNLQGEYDPKKKILSVYTIDGRCRQYKPCGGDDYMMRLFREILPSGNKILYYDDLRGNATKVICTNSNENKVFAQFEIGVKFQKVSKIKTSEGTEIELIYNKFKEENAKRFQFKEIYAPHSPPVSYSYHTSSKDKNCHEKISGKYFPDNRYLKVEYYVDRDNLVGDTILSLDEHPSWRNKVKQLLAPCGVDDTPISLYQFYYRIDHYKKKRHAVTEVRDALNHKINYHYCPEGRITAIELFTGNHPDAYQVFSVNRFYWGEKGTRLHGDLIGKALESQDGSIIHYRHLKYDGRFNVTEDRLYGNISGYCNVSPEIDSKGNVIENGCESYAVKKTYSNDRFDLLKKEEHPNGKTVLYEYKPGTNLLTAVYKSDGDKIYSRLFNDYTEDAILATTISDDGSGD